MTEWRVVFWITFLVHMAKIGIFTMWASAEVQPWNSGAEECAGEPLPVEDGGDIDVDENRRRTISIIMS